MYNYKLVVNGNRAAYISQTEMAITCNSAPQEVASKVAYKLCQYKIIGTRLQIPIL